MHKFASLTNPFSTTPYLQSSYRVYNLLYHFISIQATSITLMAHHPPSSPGSSRPPCPLHLQPVEFFCPCNNAYLCTSCLQEHFRINAHHEPVHLEGNSPDDESAGDTSPFGHRSPGPGLGSGPDHAPGVSPEQARVGELVRALEEHDASTTQVVHPLLALQLNARDVLETEEVEVSTRCLQQMEFSATRQHLRAEYTQRPAHTRNIHPRTTNTAIHPRVMRTTERTGGDSADEVPREAAKWAGRFVRGVRMAVCNQRWVGDSMRPLHMLRLLCLLENC